MQSAKSLSQVGSWKASLRLTYEMKHNKTVLAEREHSGPFKVQRSLYPEGLDCCHTYLLHPPGGLVNGDHLLLDVNCRQHSHVLITTPSAGKAYACASKTARQDQRLRVGKGATLEFLPQEMIVFNAAKVELSTHVRLAGDAKLMLFDCVVLGLSAGDELFVDGEVSQSIIIQRNRMPLLIEKMAFSAADEFCTSIWGLNGNTCVFTLIATPCDDAVLSKVRSLMETLASDVLSSATLIKDVLIVRVLSKESHEAKECLERVWAEVRSDVVNKPASTPRIWMT
ncbi:MAG: urease accessory protein UreD [Pseudomonadota bacterium]